jgi:hypothetical protein
MQAIWSPDVIDAAEDLTFISRAGVFAMFPHSTSSLPFTCKLFRDNSSQITCPHSWVEPPKYKRITQNSISTDEDRNCDRGVLWHRARFDPTLAKRCCSMP